MPDDNPTPTTEPKRSLSLLASEMFGHDFHGEVKKPAAASEGEGGEEGAGEEGEGQEAPPENEGAEADAEGDSGEQEGRESEGEEEATITSLQELIEANEWDPEYVNSLKVAVKIDGKAGEATLKDLVENYQKGKFGDQLREEAKAEKRAAEQERTQKIREAQEQVVAAAELIKSIESKINDDATATNWRQLRDTDPAEYAAKMVELERRRADVAEMKRQAIEAWNKAEETKQSDLNKNLEQRLAAERAALLEKIPEWRDSERAKAEKTEVLNDLIERGFSREEAMGASDHRLLLLARDAMLHRKMTSKTDVARKKMAKVPKVMKPGAPKPAQQQAKEKTDKLRSKLRETGSLDDAAALLRARRTGG